MGLRPLDGASVGQPNRIDQNGEAHQERLRAGVNLEIPKTGIDPLKKERNERSPLETRTGLTQEEAARERGDAWQSRLLSAWERYQSGRRRRDGQPTRGAVVIDGQGVVDPNPPGPLVRRPPVPASDEDTEAWRAWKTAHRDAARIEEYAQDKLARFLKEPRVVRRWSILNSR